ncbi:hypothetical protein FCU94_12500 [Vibrio sp. JPW-9-11-11]|uniref:DUF6482 family protein n=1 Tax=Vibrio sp. JPW-9-11-11 TaxID=1416532 RepID=UPI0015947287|nr:DUF6482 family protein [Vibrio sp. JPW-9-11-11]NVD07705.1 hypothetical protein [Vibrio sp. JPW-9-11-11]
MKLALSKLEKFFYVDKLVIHSLDMALYHASVVVDGEEFYIIDDQGQFLRTHSIVDLQRQCSRIKAKAQVLRHQSAYDEMIGTPIRQQSNQLEVPLHDNQYY